VAVGRSGRHGGRGTEAGHGRHKSGERGAPPGAALLPGVDLDALAEQLQRDGAVSFVKSWHSLLQGIASRSAALKAASE
jgi:hypothetical protein